MGIEQADVVVVGSGPADASTSFALADPAER